MSTYTEQRKSVIEYLIKRGAVDFTRESGYWTERQMAGEDGKRCLLFTNGKKKYIVSFDYTSSGVAVVSGSYKGGCRPYTDIEDVPIVLIWWGVFKDRFTIATSHGVSVYLDNDGIGLLLPDGEVISLLPRNATRLRRIAEQMPYRLSWKGGIVFRKHHYLGRTSEELLFTNKFSDKPIVVTRGGGAVDDVVRMLDKAIERVKSAIQ